jgi:hypothetical protein
MAKRASKVGLRLLIFDTTHESNRFGCYTCVLGTESEMGETEILFMALIMHQVCQLIISRRFFYLER